MSDHQAHRSLEVGDVFTLRIVENLQRAQIVMYAGASGDFHALHTDEIFATQVAGYPSVFAHGMLTMALTGKILTETVGANNLRQFGLRFLGQVFPGDTLDAFAKVTDVFHADGERRAKFEIYAMNDAGLEVVRGTAEAKF